jgi:hypothetical protein
LSSDCTAGDGVGQIGFQRRSGAAAFAAFQHYFLLADFLDRVIFANLRCVLPGLRNDLSQDLLRAWTAAG